MNPFKSIQKFYIAHQSLAQKLGSLGLLPMAGFGSYKLWVFVYPDKILTIVLATTACTVTGLILGMLNLSCNENESLQNQLAEAKNEQKFIYHFCIKFLPADIEQGLFAAYCPTCLLQMDLQIPMPEFNVSTCSVNCQKCAYNVCLKDSNGNYIGAQKMMELVRAFY